MASFSLWVERRPDGDGAHTLWVSSHSVEPLQLRLDGRAHGCACGFAPDISHPPSGRVDLFLDPGARRTLRFVVEPTARLSFLLPRRVPFRIVAERVNGAPEWVQVDGESEHQPNRVGPTLLALFVLLVALLLPGSPLKIFESARGASGVVQGARALGVTRPDPELPIASLVIVEPVAPPPSGAPAAPLAVSAPEALPGTYEALFREAAARYNLDWRAVAAVAYHESRLVTDAVGGVGEYGLMQIHPVTWEEWAPLVGVEDPFDPRSNVLVGAAYLAFVEEYSAELGYDDDHWAFLAYNWGPNNLRRHAEGTNSWESVPPRNQNYVYVLYEHMQPEQPWWARLGDSVDGE